MNPARIAACLAFGAIANVQAAPPSKLDSFVGDWTVTDIVGYSDISDGIPGAKRLLGQSVKISRTELGFDGDTCQLADGYSIRLVNTAPLLNREYQVNLADTGLPRRTLYLDTNCAGVFMMDAHRIVLGAGGVVVRATKP